MFDGHSGAILLVGRGILQAEWARFDERGAAGGAGQVSLGHRVSIENQPIHSAFQVCG